MVKTFKNIRKLYNAKLLVVSSDTEVKSEVEDEFDGYFKELKLVTTLKQTIQTLRHSSYDIVVIDTKLEDKNFDEVCANISKIVPNLPKIVISHTPNNKDIVTAISCSAYTFLAKPLRLADVKLAIIMCLNQTKRGDKIEFQNGIYFDEYRDQFFKEGGSLIDFTRLEKGFLKLLLSRRDEIVDYDIIKDVVWKGKNMSIYTMRNIVNKIRQKTYYEIIKNHSNKGYTIDDCRK